ncbi:hypothetical protein ABMA28_013025 [Loxostege sticticalis]|uniref:Carboxypeptidase n=1 Tax=Loxostege sticticalis TaxID=481309 RepID=A0ABD0S5I8_LOXSC
MLLRVAALCLLEQGEAGYDQHVCTVSNEIKTESQENSPTTKITENALDNSETRTSCSDEDITDDDNAASSGDLEPEQEQKIDNGTALMLTPFVEKGLLEKGRKAAEVDPRLFLGVKFYTGYLTVDKTYDSNTFFWYFPVQGTPVHETPWILWLQGGPGVSSVAGVFDEIGPFKVNSEGNLAKNPHTWHQNHSLVFIENPIGSGYSFTNHKDGYARDMATYIKHLYSALGQFLTLFPELRSAPLFIAGESYAGMFVPSLAMEIHRRKDFSEEDINLKGLILGNVRTEPDMLAELIRPFYHFGLLVEEQMQLVQPLVDALREDIAANRSVGAKQKWTRLVKVLKALAHQGNEFNFLQDSLDLGDYERFLVKSEVKRALHVGDIKYTLVNYTVKDELAANFLSNPRSTIEALLNHYDVLALCGQLDLMMSCAVAAEHHRRWRWNRSDEFLNATRYPLMYEGKLAGYHKSGGRMTEVVVRGAGHLAPMDAPAPTSWLVAQWTRVQLLPKPPTIPLHVIREYVSFLVGLRSCSSITAAARRLPSTAAWSSRRGIEVSFSGATLALAAAMLVLFLLLWLLAEAGSLLLLWLGRKPTKNAIDNLNTTGSGEGTTDDDDAAASGDLEPELKQKVDNGTALMLSPFVENGLLEEGRKAAEVDPSLFLGVKFYTGYFTVDKTYDSNTFFWYFPVQGIPVNEAPWIIWLQGGPGVSVVLSVFDEIGPFKVNTEGNLESNPHTWLQNHSLVFIESPIGAGYSFTNHNNGFTRDIATYLKHLYSALGQFLTLFPELRKAPLFIAGQSYAGLTVQDLAMEIHRRKHLPGGDINLKGLILGNARTESDLLAEFVRPFYHFGLLVEEQMQLVQPLVDGLRGDIAANRSVGAKQKRNRLVTVMKALSHQKDEYNFLHDKDLGEYERFLLKSEVKRALHVGDIKITLVNYTVMDELAPSFLFNSRPMIETLLNHYDVLAMCGQLDLMMSCAVAAEHHRRWRWDRSAEFLNATRYPLLYEGRLAGYHKSGGRMTEVMVRGAGHLAPMDAPAPTRWLVAQWTRGLRLPQPPTTPLYVIREYVSGERDTLL